MVVLGVVIESTHSAPGVLSYASQVPFALLVSSFLRTFSSNLFCKIVLTPLISVLL